MADHKTIKLRDGQEVLVSEVSFQADDENWSYYTLDDGTKLRVRPSVLRVFRIVDEDGNPQVTEDGDPHVVVRHKMDIVATES